MTIQNKKMKVCATIAILTCKLTYNYSIVYEFKQTHLATTNVNFVIIPPICIYIIGGESCSPPTLMKSMEVACVLTSVRPYMSNDYVYVTGLTHMSFICTYTCTRTR